MKRPLDVKFHYGPTLQDLLSVTVDAPTVKAAICKALDVACIPYDQHFLLRSEPACKRFADDGSYMGIYSCWSAPVACHGQHVWVYELITQN